MTNINKDIKEIIVYKTIDGVLFEDYAQAITHNDKVKPLIEIEQLLEANTLRIRQHALSYENEERIRFNMEKLTISDIHQPYFGATKSYGLGWDCNDKSNFTKKCVYVYIQNSIDSEECCVFCGNPEERK